MRVRAMPKILIAVLGSVLSLAPPVAAGAKDCPGAAAELEASAFLQGVNGAVTYRDIVRLPLAVRKSIMHSLSAQLESELWLEHFRSIEVWLSQPQRDILSEAMGFITPDLFERASIGGSAAVRDEIQHIRALLSAAFSDQEVRALLSFSIDVQALPSRDIGAKDAPQDDPPDCLCSTWFPEECPGSLLFCKETDGTLCTVTSFGCGDFWLFECNGRCCATFRPKACA